MEKMNEEPPPSLPIKAVNTNGLPSAAQQVLLHCSHILFHAKSEQELLAEICRICINDAGYIQAWIAYPYDREHQDTNSMDSIGLEGNTDQSTEPWHESALDYGPAEVALRSKSTYVIDDIQTDPNFIPWREIAQKKGYASIAAFPLLIKDQHAAVLLLYAQQANSFAANELILLEHFSVMLTSAIENTVIKQKSRQIEASLRESEQRFRYMLDTSPIAVRIAKNKGRFIAYSNPSYNTLLNTNAKKIYGVYPGDFYVNRDEYEQILNSLEQGVAVTNRLVNLSAPGSEDKWALSTYLPITFEGEDSVLGWFYDITDRKNIEDALLLSEEEYIKAFSSVPDSLSITTLYGGVFIEVNDGATKILGYQRDELVGHSTVELGLWLDIKQRATLLKEIEQHGEIRNFEVKLIVKNGDVRDIMLCGEAITINKRPCVLLSARDITEKVESNRELQQLRNYLANIINSMPSIIIGVNLDGTVTQWNHEASRITGITTEEAQGKLLPTVFPRLAIEMSRIFDAIKTRKEFIDPRQSYNHSGEVRYEDITVYPLITNDTEGAIIRIDDVTERVRFEKMMVQSEKIMSVGGIAAGMAHEINNPLSALLQTATVLNNRLNNSKLQANIVAAELTGIDLDSLRKYMENRDILSMLASLNDASLRISDIIDNMLNFARKTDIVSPPLAITELLDKTLSLVMTDHDLQKLQSSESLKIIREYQHKLPKITCEENKIQQVFMNLFRNGIQAMQEAETSPPTFTLSTKYQVADEMVTIEITDNGPGIEAATCKRIFEPFFTTKTDSDGTGLGLSISYFIITEIHGGEMTVQSELGVGSRFIIRLPITHESK